MHQDPPLLPPSLAHTRTHTCRAALSNTGLVLPMMFSPTQKGKKTSAQSAPAKLLSNTSQKRRSLELEDKVDKNYPPGKKPKIKKKLNYILYIYISYRLLIPQLFNPQTHTAASAASSCQSYKRGWITPPSSLPFPTPKPACCNSAFQTRNRAVGERVSSSS